MLVDSTAAVAGSVMAVEGELSKKAAFGFANDSFSNHHAQAMHEIWE
jgi:hypothetical protein